MPGSVQLSWLFLCSFHSGYALTVVIIGLVLLLLGFLLGIPILWTIGIIVLVVGLVLMLFGAAGRPVYGRRHYW